MLLASPDFPEQACLFILTVLKNSQSLAVLGARDNSQQNTVPVLLGIYHLYHIVPYIRNELHSSFYFPH